MLRPFKVGACIRLNLITYVAICIVIANLLATFSNAGFAVACFEEEKATHSFVMYRIVYLLGAGSSSLFNLAVPVKVSLIVLCAMLLMFPPLHLMVTYCAPIHNYIHSMKSVSVLYR